MLGKYIKNFSPRSELWNLGGSYFVKREKTDSLFEFYNTSNFKNKVSTFLDESLNDIRCLFEEGEELNPKEEESIKKLATILADLYNDIIATMPMKEYIEREYKKRIKNLPKSVGELPEYQQKMINDYFIKFKDNALKSTVNLSWIHGDLKPDNVIINGDKLTIIDWEWCKKGSYIQDIQRFSSCLNEKEKEIFINEVERNLNYKESNPKFLYLFHEFLLLLLRLSKNKIDFDGFISILKKGGIDNIHNIG